MEGFHQLCVSIGASLDAPMKGNWKSGPFGCYGDCNDCGSTPCLAMHIGCGGVQAGMTEFKLGGANGGFPTFCCLGACCPCLPCLAIVQRKQIREKYDLEGSVALDVALGCCCSACTVAQCANQVDCKFTDYKVDQLLAPQAPAMENKA